MSAIFHQSQYDALLSAGAKAEQIARGAAKHLYGEEQKDAFAVSGILKTVRRLSEKSAQNSVSFLGILSDSSKFRVYPDLPTQPKPQIFPPP